MRSAQSWFLGGHGRADILLRIISVTMERPKLVFSRREKSDRLSEADDQELLCAMKEDDEDAFEVLVRRKANSLHAMVLRMVRDRDEAHDIVQMAFVKIWDHRHRYDDRWKPNTWMYRIANNLAIDHIRARKTRHRYNEPMQRHLVDVSDPGPTRALDELQHGEVDSIFDRLAEFLSPRQKTVFLLREVQGLSSAEVSQIVGCRETTVRNHLFNARQVLRREIRRQYPEYAPKEESP